jgi:hypothetical protein
MDLGDDHPYLDNLVEFSFGPIGVAAVLLFVGPAGLVMVMPRAMAGIHDGRSRRIRAARRSTVQPTQEARCQAMLWTAVAIRSSASRSVWRGQAKFSRTKPGA